MKHTWQEKARALRQEIYALYLACRDPRTPLAARIVTACVVAYAFSPIDLIPDFVPVFGYLDDLILVPLGIALALRLIPPEVLSDCRARAGEVLAAGKPVSRAAAAVIVVIWVLLAAGLAVVALKILAP
jgi:uncharacterized membrane protein YkvA (DUF1232 family)